ncbi:MAG: transglycosylase domain-containing protein [Clostridia bacterium]|nr:transglycosylase domain-containing protein [Clostridia bacterium]
MSKKKNEYGQGELYVKRSFESFRKVLSRIFKTILIVAVTVACVFVGLLVGVVAGCIITTEKLEVGDLYITGFTSFIYDSDGEVIAKLKGSDNINRVWVSKDEVPKYLLDAIVAIEDERFYTHPGVDVKRTASAFLGYFIPGMSNHGGSTLTQQVIKNVTGDDAVSVPRKIREIWRAYQLEKEYSKDEILEMYVNIIYLGSDLYGVQAASRAYFQKEIGDLSLAECSFLAGITNNPRKFNPLTTLGRTNAYKRQITILDKMLELGKISEEEYIEAIETELVFNEGYSSEVVSSLQTYFVDAVIADVRTDLMALGYTKNQANNMIYNSGVSIYTTQDSRIQAILDKEFCDPVNFPLNSTILSPEDQAQAAMVIMDQYTGKVVALYGGYGDKSNANAWNRAIYAQRQPGSSIKPILVYGPLIDTHQETAGSVRVDEEVHLDYQHPENLWPRNHDNSYGGPTTIKDAIRRSVNIVAVLFYKDHVQQNLQYLADLGIDRRNETQLAAGLGGFNVGVSPLEMCAAYVPFANSGIYYKPVNYTKVIDRNGKTIIEKTPESRVVYKDYRTPYVMTTMLRSVVMAGTGGYGRIYKNDGTLIPTAGKTGTTTSTYDYWFVGYTGYYTAATWYGYDKQTEMGEAESNAAIKIWGKVMKQIHEDLEIKEFDVPTGIVTKKVCKMSGLTPSEYCLEQNIEELTYIEGTEPKDYDICHACDPEPEEPFDPEDPEGQADPADPGEPSE